MYSLRWHGPASLPMKFAQREIEPSINGGLSLLKEQMRLIILDKKTMNTSGIREMVDETMVVLFYRSIFIMTKFPLR